MANCKVGCNMVAYPESLPEDWESRLNALDIGYAWALHDKDTKPDGTLKKAHIHLYFMQTLSSKQKKYVGEVTGIHYIEDTRSAGDMLDYLTHENDEDKYHYSKDIINYSPAWCQEAFDDMLAKCVKTVNQYDIIIDIEENNIYDIRALTLYYISNYNAKERDAYIKCISSHNHYLREYLYQKKQTTKPKEDKQCKEK